MLVALAHAFGLVVLGGHALVPAWLARRTEGRRAWALAALPLALAALLGEAQVLTAHPDALLAVANAGHRPVALLPQVAALLGVALLAADGLLLAGWRQLEAAGWRVLAGFGVALLIAQALLAEAARATTGPTGSLSALCVAAGGRALLALAGGALFLPRRPWIALAAPAALCAHLLALPDALRLAVIAGALLPALLAAGTAFAIAPLVPPRLRRVSLAVGMLLAALWLAGVEATAAAFPTATAPPLPLPPA